MTPYDNEFYQTQAADSRRSAAAVVPLIIDLVRPRSVIDIGCGVGTWLAEFERNGISDYLGVDGDYVSPELLQIPRERFQPADLKEPISLPRRYDLAVSLEVAEHLPAERAATFVASLTQLAPVALFSAAVPFQGGTSHINEQWPEYWRHLFRQRGWRAVDAIRPLVWGRPEVSWWYQQNVVLYCSPEILAAHPALQPTPDERPLDIVHPALFENNMQYLAPNLGAVFKKLPPMIAAAITDRLKKLTG